MTLQLPVSSAELTRAEQKILDFINTNPDTFLFSSIGQLAQQLELSDATLSRSARHVGCQDFKELKNLVLEQSASGPAVKLAGALQEGESFSLPVVCFSAEKWRSPLGAYYFTKCTASRGDNGWEYTVGAEAIS